MACLPLTAFTTSPLSHAHTHTHISLHTPLRQQPLYGHC